MPKRRSRPERHVKPVLHIYCEGEKTEPNYLNGYISDHYSGSRDLHIIKVEKTENNTPVQLVDEAVAAKRAAKKDNLLKDEFWVVYDRENQTKYSDALHAQARNKADSNDIHIALSNVCFEVWLLLHFEDSVGPYQNFNDLWRRSPLRKHLPNYKKGAPQLYSKLSHGIDAARGHAEKLNKCTENGASPKSRQPHEWNPYTDVYLLLDAIDEFVKLRKR